MDIQAKKIELIEWLLGIQDEQLIKRIENVKSELDWWNEISDGQKKLIAKGLLDIEKGNTHTSEDVRKSIRERIEKKSA